jgi:predicted ArsR family transcriptional regulator
VSDDLADQVAGVGALAEPVRRALYLFVAAQPEPVSREQAANALDLPLHSAKFHLDRLVSDGLLEVEFRRLSGRSGPGAGRPSKLYRRSSREFSVSLPERRYDLVGQVMAAAIDRSMRESVPIADALREAALTEGRRIAEDAADGGAGDLGRVVDVLARNGYEPGTSDGCIHLANCPFDRLAGEHTELVCGMNLHLVTGVVEGVGAAALTPELAPEEGLCCVKVRR